MANPKNQPWEREFGHATIAYDDDGWWTIQVFGSVIAYTPHYDVALDAIREATTQLKNAYTHMVEIKMAQS